MTSKYKDTVWRDWKKKYDAEKNPEIKSKMKQPNVKDVEYGQLIPYHMSGVKVPSCFNGVQAVQKDDPDHFFTAKDYQIDGLPGRYLPPS